GLWSVMAFRSAISFVGLICPTRKSCLTTIVMRRCARSCGPIIRKKTGCCAGTTRRRGHRSRPEGQGMHSTKARLMSSFRGRMLVAAETAAAEEVDKNDVLLNDPWYAPTSRLKGRVDWDGWEYITSQQIMDALEVPMHARRGGLFRRLTKLMREHGWEPI